MLPLSLSDSACGMHFTVHSRPHTPDLFASRCAVETRELDGVTFFPFSGWCECVRHRRSVSFRFTTIPPPPPPPSMTTSDALLDVHRERKKTLPYARTTAARALALIYKAVCFPFVHQARAPGKAAMTKCDCYFCREQYPTDMHGTTRRRRVPNTELWGRRVLSTRHRARCLYLSSRLVCDDLRGKLVGVYGVM